jgi:hypothetical protein
MGPEIAPSEAEGRGMRALADRVRRAIETAAGPALEAGRALVREETVEDRPQVLLEPAAAGAAGLVVWIDSPFQVTCGPGDSEMTYEVFSKDPAEIEESVEGLARALAEGSYREVVATGEGKVKVVAEWPEGDRVVRPRLNVWREPDPDSPGWKSMRYEAY